MVTSQKHLYYFYCKRFLAWCKLDVYRLGFAQCAFFSTFNCNKKNRQHTDNIAPGRLLPNFREATQIVSTFCFTMIAWVFFRSKSIADAFSYLSEIFSRSLFSMPEIFPKNLIVLIFAFVLVEWLQREKQHALKLDYVGMPNFIRLGIYLCIIFIIAWFGGGKQQFIYFQF